MTEIIHYHFKQCSVRYFPAADYLETVFQDGKKCPAQFTFKQHDIDKAVELGYAPDKEGGVVQAIRQMHREHELSHTFIAEALGEPWCPVLRSVAVKGPCEGAWEREDLVLDFQRSLNGVGEIAYHSRNLRGLDANKIKRGFIARFRK